MSEATFIARCLSGSSSLDNIDDFVDQWHDTNSGLPIWTFLGMDFDEYGLWVENPDILDAILRAHARDIGIEEAVRQLVGESEPERSATAARVEAWLRQRSLRTA